MSLSISPIGEIESMKDEKLKYFVPAGTRCRLWNMVTGDKSPSFNSTANCYYFEKEMCEDGDQTPGWTMFVLPNNSEDWTHVEYHCEFVEAIKV